MQLYINFQIVFTFSATLWPFCRQRIRSPTPQPPTLPRTSRTYAVKYKVVRSSATTTTTPNNDNSRRSSSNSSRGGVGTNKNKQRVRSLKWQPGVAAGAAAAAATAGGDVGLFCRSVRVFVSVCCLVWVLAQLIKAKTLQEKTKQLQLLPLDYIKQPLLAIWAAVIQKFWPRHRLRFLRRRCRCRCHRSTKPAARA